MPTVTEQRTAGFRTCSKKRKRGNICVGYDSEPIDVIRETVSFSFQELGGDLPGFEKSIERLRPADEADLTCPHCGAATSISLEPRPQYDEVSGQDPERLMYLDAAEAERNTLLERQTIAIERQLAIAEAGHSQEMTELRQLVAEMRAERHASAAPADTNGDNTTTEAPAPVKARRKAQSDE